MTRAALLATLIGVAALLLAWLLPGARILPSYLPAWLFFLSAPLGALPLVMGMELLGAGDSAVARALRRLLPALPLAALLVLPLLLRLHAVYAWTGEALPGFLGHWLRPGPFVVREAIFLAVWTILALVFMRRPHGAQWRRGLAGLGLVLHMTMGTMAAVDWTLSLQPGLNASAFGLLLMLAQCGVALSASVLLAAALGDRRAVAMSGRPMLVLLGAWLFLHFSQYLVIWSANLPGEIVWYQQRTAGLGLAPAGFALACCVLALLPRRLAGRLPVVAGIAGLILLLHLIEALWLTTPAWRGQFAISGADLLPMLGVGGLVAGCVLGLCRPEAALART